MVESPSWDAEVLFPYCLGILSKFAFFPWEVMAAQVWDCPEVLPSLVWHAGHWETQKTVEQVCWQTKGRMWEITARWDHSVTAFLPALFRSNNLCWNCWIFQYFHSVLVIYSSCVEWKFRVMFLFWKRKGQRQRDDKTSRGMKVQWASKSSLWMWGNSRVLVARWICTIMHSQLI